MIKFTKGNILESDAQALVNTVNVVGVMGKGIALQFKRTYPNNFKAYVSACKNNLIEIGKLFVFQDSNLANGDKIIINFPTKRHWAKPSEYSFIEAGLDDLIKVIEAHEIKSIAIPPLGAGNGGLNWIEVKRMIETKLKDLDLDVIIYEPTDVLKEKLKKERVKLTEARALLLYILFDLVKNGEFVSEFSSEKVCYFLQKFGAKKFFKLDFRQNFYGPYSGKVRFVLNALNGSYIMGFSDMNKKPFDPLTLVSDGYENVKEFVENDDELLKIANDTSKFLSGFYSDFSLELLSSISYIIEEKNIFDEKTISNELANWNTRKRSLFSNPKFIQMSIEHLKSFSMQN